MGVDTSTQPLTIYNMVSSLLTNKISLIEGILLPTFDMNYQKRKKNKNTKMLTCHFTNDLLNQSDKIHYFKEHSRGVHCLKTVKI